MNEPRCSGTVTISCSNSDIRHVTLVQNPIISHERGNRTLIWKKYFCFYWKVNNNFRCFHWNHQTMKFRAQRKTYMWKGTVWVIIKTTNPWTPHYLFIDIDTQKNKWHHSTQFQNYRNSIQIHNEIKPAKLCFLSSLSFHKSLKLEWIWIWIFGV